MIGASTFDIGALSSKYPILSDAAIFGWGLPPGVIKGVMAEDCAVLRDKAIPLSPLEPQTEPDD